MGFEDRQYLRDDESYSYTGNRGGGGFAPGTWTIVTTIIVINMVIFLLDAFTPKTQGDYHWLSEMMALRTDQPWKIWTWMTYGFAHASLDSPTGIWHVGGNMLALFFLGRSVESRIGRNEFLKFYLIAIVVSAVVYLLYGIANGSGKSSMVGASGAVTAVVFLFICKFPHEKIQLLFHRFQCLPGYSERVSSCWIYPKRLARRAPLRGKRTWAGLHLPQLTFF